MAHDPDTVPAPTASTPRARIIEAGHTSSTHDLEILAAGLASDDGLIRASALGGLARRGALREATLIAALSDEDPQVQMRAAQLAAHPRWSSATDDALAHTLRAEDELVVLAALVALADRQPPDAFEQILILAEDEQRPLVMEEAVAVLGAFGDQRGLDVVLRATQGKPALRRRSVAALGGFMGPAVEEALDQLSNDRDWQVRQAVAMLRREPLDDDLAIG